MEIMGNLQWENSNFLILSLFMWEEDKQGVRKRGIEIIFEWAKMTILSKIIWV